MLSLQTERLKIRSLNATDNHQIYSYASKPEISKFLTWETHKTLEDTNDYLSRIVLLSKKFPLSNLGIEISQHEGKIIIGTVGLLPKYISSPHTYELGFVLNQEWWGRGYACEAVLLLLKYAFSSFEIERVEAFCVIENIKSWKLLEKIGMTREGTRRKFFYKQKNFYDIYMYSILKNEWNNLKLVDN